MGTSRGFGSGFYHYVTYYFTPPIGISILVPELELGSQEARASWSSLSRAHPDLQWVFRHKISV